LTRSVAVALARWEARTEFNANGDFAALGQTPTIISEEKRLSQIFVFLAIFCLEPFV